MESFEHPERMQRPELDLRHPELIFEYARKQEAWLRILKNKGGLSEAFEHLIEVLEARITELLGSSLEVVVSASDVYHTQGAPQEGPTYTIEASPLTLDDDAKLVGHLLQGIFRGFHIGLDGELRAYIETTHQKHKLMSGVFISYQSVRVEDSEISLLEYVTSQRLEEIDEYIISHLEELSDASLLLVESLKENLTNLDVGVTNKLHAASLIIVELERAQELSNLFMDHLLEMIQLRLRLDSPQDITASAYQEDVGSGYLANQGPIVFENVVPGIGIIGDYRYRSLALLFFHGDVGAVQIPIRHVTHVEKTE